MLRRTILFLLIPLSLSALTHLWNPAGFPDIFYDEGVYMRRAMHVLVGSGPQELTTFYDHPFFGQIFLAGIFKIIGYPYFLNSSSNIQSIEMLYTVPRILMGILAVIDTFLIYKISEYRYNRNVAIIASILFAVMPISWFTRRILLEPIQLPFLLSSILFVLYAQAANRYNRDNLKRTKDIAKKIDKREMILIALSGILLGLAMFIKIPALSSIPLVAYLIASHNKSSGRWMSLGLWFIPVVLIPIIWPVYSLAVGQFDSWWNGIIFQTTRENISLLKNIFNIFNIDPVLLILFVPGLIIAVLRKDLFILFWTIPNVIFLYIIGYVSFRLFIPLIPIFCITSALMIVYLTDKIKHNTIRKMLPWTIISVVGIFGLISTLTLVTTDVTIGQFQAAAYVSTYIKNFENKFHIFNQITIAASPTYSWIFKYVYENDNVLLNYRDVLYQPIKTDKILLIDDDHFKQDIKSNKRLNLYYNNTVTIATFDESKNNFDESKYPYSSMILNHEGLKSIEIRIANNTKTS